MLLGLSSRSSSATGSLCDIRTVLISLSLHYSKCALDICVPSVTHRIKWRSKSKHRKKMCCSSTKNKARGRKGGSAVKSIVCSSRQPKFNSQPPAGGSHPYITPVLGDLAPTSGLHGHCTHMVHEHTCRDTYTCRMPIHIKINKNILKRI